MARDPKEMTRKQAERAIARGDDASAFTDHRNRHVRNKAKRKLGLSIEPSAAQVRSAGTKAAAQ